MRTFNLHKLIWKRRSRGSSRSLKNIILIRLQRRFKHFRFWRMGVNAARIWYQRTSIEMATLFQKAHQIRNVKKWWWSPLTSPRRIVLTAKSLLMRSVISICNSYKNQKVRLLVMVKIYNRIRRIWMSSWTPWDNLVRWCQAHRFLWGQKQLDLRLTVWCLRQRIDSTGTLSN